MDSRICDQHTLRGSDIAGTDSRSPCFFIIGNRCIICSITISIFQFCSDVIRVHIGLSCQISIDFRLCILQSTIDRTAIDDSRIIFSYLTINCHIHLIGFNPIHIPMGYARVAAVFHSD